LPCFLQMTELSCVACPSIAHRPCSNCSSSVVIRCSTASQRSPRTAHWLCVSAQARHSQHSTQHIAQHTSSIHRLSASGTHNCRSASPTTEMAKSALTPCIVSSVADLSSGWHADGLLVCASTPHVSMSIPPSLLLSSSCNEWALLAAERIPKRHRPKQACHSFPPRHLLPPRPLNCVCPRDRQREQKWIALPCSTVA